MSESTATPKKESSKTETPASPEASSPAAGSGASSGSPSSSGGARPISYFSSVSTNAYRSGWDAVFNGAKPAARPVARRRHKAAPAPVSLELDISELDAPLRTQIEDAFRRKAKTQRLAFDKRAKRWRLICELGG